MKQMKKANFLLVIILLGVIAAFAYSYNAYVTTIVADAAYNDRDILHNYNNEIISKLVEESSVSGWSEIVEQYEDVPTRTDTDIAELELADALSDLLSKLTDAERELFCDRYLRGVPYEVLAEQRHMTPTAVRKRCSRIHKKLLKYIKLLFLLG